MEQSFFETNRERLYESISEGEIFVICSGSQVHRTADELYRFFANRSFVYLTGIDDPECILLVWRLHGEIKETLYVRAPDLMAEAFTGARITKDAASTVSGIMDVRYRESLEGDFARLAGNVYFTKLHIPLEVNGAQEKTDANRAFARMAAERYPNLTQADIFPKIASQRMRKTPSELENMKKALEITDKGIRRMMRRAGDSSREIELYAEFMDTIHRSGAVETAFRPIISCGESNFFLHYDSPTGPLTDDGLCLVDVGAIYDHCCVDVSRVFPRNGKFSPRQKAVYQLALEANDAITDEIKPGMAFSEIDRRCREKCFTGLKELGLIDDISDIGKYVWHGCSHHLGFDVHDVGTCHIPIEKDMVFTMDVGIYIREWGIGLRIEDDVLVTDGGLGCLSKSIPRTVEEIEAEMAI